MKAREEGGRPLQHPCLGLGAEHPRQQPVVSESALEVAELGSRSISGNLTETIRDRLVRVTVRVTETQIGAASSGPDSNKWAKLSVRVAPAGRTRPCTEFAGCGRNGDRGPSPRRSREWLKVALVECQRCHQVEQRCSPIQRHCAGCAAELKRQRSQRAMARRRSGRD
jgi:hypothetical protein